jgi:NTP pyrophosphatase (non-canonical NTP hydrolase)
MTDATTTVGSLRSDVREFVAERDWERFHTPKNLAMSIAIEAAEILEHFQWFDVAESAERVANAEIRAEVGDEMADVAIYLLSLANSMELDLSAAVRAKLARNEVRFPVERVRGRLG